VFFFYVLLRFGGPRRAFAVDRVTLSILSWRTLTALVEVLVTASFGFVVSRPS
jgi:hypothetical protein